MMTYLVRGATSIDELEMAELLEALRDGRYDRCIPDLHLEHEHLEPRTRVCNQRERSDRLMLVEFALEHS